MPDTPAPTSAVQTSSLAAAGTSGALIVAQWIVAPEWPPPLPVLTVLVGVMTPVVYSVSSFAFDTVNLAWVKTGSPTGSFPFSLDCEP